jgi:ParB-like chromosome segregation protein Spo0J
MARVARVEAPKILQGESKIVDVASISPHPENARRGNVPVIKASIVANGFYGKVLVWRETNQIVVGSHRWKAAVELGMQKIPVEIVSLTERQAAKIMAADNRTSDLAGYDDQLLASLLKRLRADGDFEGTGYAEDDLLATLKRLEPPTAPGAFPELDPGGMHLARECPKCGFNF